MALLPRYGARSAHVLCGSPQSALVCGLLKRHASTATSAAPSSSPASLLNPPPSTLPPVLTTPTRQAEQSAPAYYFALGKSYLSFYKTGIKSVYTNYKLSRPLSSRPLPTSSVTPGQSQPTHSSSDQSNASSVPLTRAEWQLLRRSRDDLRRVPIFALVFAICGEFTPLVVVFLGPSVVPRPCRIPKQVAGARAQAEKRRKESFRDGVDSSMQSRGEADADADADSQHGGVADALTRPQALHVGRSLGLYSGVWDRVGGLPAAMLRGRIQRWERYVQLDDALLRGGGGGGVDALAEEEVRLACEERGLDVLGRKELLLRQTLQQWLDCSSPLREMVMKRPGSWDEVDPETRHAEK